MTRRARTALATLVPLLALTACGGGEDGGGSAAPQGEQKSGGTPVGVKLLKFDPEQAKVAPGGTVTWTLADGIRHVLVQGTFEEGPDGLRTSEKDDGTFELELAKKGDAVSHTYDEAGTFTYYCTIHKGMNGSVVVG